MQLSELLKTNASINLTISLDDLRTFSNELIEKTKTELQADIVAQQNEVYLTRLEACKFLQVDSATLWRWAKRDYLSPISIGGKRMYRKSDLLNILNGGRN